MTNCRPERSVRTGRHLPPLWPISNDGAPRFLFYFLTCSTRFASRSLPACVRDVRWVFRPYAPRSFPEWGQLSIVPLYSNLPRDDGKQGACARGLLSSGVASVRVAWGSTASVLILHLSDDLLLGLGEWATPFLHPVTHQSYPCAFALSNAGRCRRRNCSARVCRALPDLCVIIRRAAAGPIALRASCVITNCQFTARPPWFRRTGEAGKRPLSAHLGAICPRTHVLADRPPPLRTIRTLQGTDILPCQSGLSLRSGVHFGN